MTESSRFAIAVFLAGERELFGDELDLHAFAGQLADDATKIIEVAGETIHGMHNHRVPLADETKQGRQLRAVHVLARRTVGERAIDGDPVELPGGVLVQGAHSGVGDSLPGDGVLPAVCVRLDSKNSVTMCQSTALQTST